MTSDDFSLKEWWLPLSVAVVGGVIVGGFLSPNPALQIAAVTLGALVLIGILVTRTAKRRVWRPLWRRFRWLATVRLTTTGRQAERNAEVDKIRDDARLSARKFQEVCDLLGVRPLLTDSTVVAERVERLQSAADRAHADAKVQITAAEAKWKADADATRSLAVLEVENAKKSAKAEALCTHKIHEGMIESARARARLAGSAEAWSEVEAQRAVPIVKPVWRVSQVAVDGFRLDNVQVDSVVGDVQIEPTNPSTFAFHSANQWTGVTPFEYFNGERMRIGRTHDMLFKVQYRDAHGDWRSGNAVLAREPRKGTIPS